MLAPSVVGSLMLLAAMEVWSINISNISPTLQGKQLEGDKDLLQLVPYENNSTHPTCRASCKIIPLLEATKFKEVSTEREK